jgi:hypothetical protein
VVIALGCPNAETQPRSNDVGSKMGKRIHSWRPQQSEPPLPPETPRCAMHETSTDIAGFYAAPYRAALTRESPCYPGWNSRFVRYFVCFLYLFNARYTTIQLLLLWCVSYYMCYQIYSIWPYKTLPLSCNSLKIALNLFRIAHASSFTHPELSS